MDGRDAPEAAFVRVCGADELWDGEMDSFDLEQGPLLLVKVDGDYRAYQGICPHQSVRLVEGELDDLRLTCRGHNWVFDLRTGQGINPRRACLAVYPVQIRGGDVYVGTVPERPGQDATGAPVAVG